MFLRRRGARRWQASNNDMASSNDFDLSQCVPPGFLDDSECPMRPIASTSLLHEQVPS